MDGRENCVLHIPKHTRRYISAQKLFLNTVFMFLHFKRKTHNFSILQERPEASASRSGFISPSETRDLCAEHFK